MMRGINHQNIFENIEDYYQFVITLDRIRKHYDDDGSPFGNLKALVDDLLSDDIQCLDFEGTSRLRPSDDKVWSLIKDRTGAINSGAFQQLPDERQRAILKELKRMGASHRQLERLTGIGRGEIQDL